MSFVNFVLPVLKPRRWDFLAFGLLFVAVDGLDRLLHLGLGPALDLDAGSLQAPWRLLSYALIQPDPWRAAGAALAVPVGMTMAARTCGPAAAWTGILVGAVVGALGHLLLTPTPGLLGASALLYAALAMGTVAWFRVRDELSFARRVDWLAGFGTLGLVLTSLLMPIVGQEPFHPEYALAFVAGLVVTAAWPRHFESVMR